MAQGIQTLSRHMLPAAPAAADDMSSNFRRTEVSIEREQLTIHYQPGVSYIGTCPQCGHDVLMLTAEAAAVTVGATRREVYRWLDQEAIHFKETAVGEVFLCSVSLLLIRPIIREIGAVRLCHSLDQQGEQS